MSPRQRYAELQTLVDLLEEIRADFQTARRNRDDPTHAHAALVSALGILHSILTDMERDDAPEPDHEHRVARIESHVDRNAALIAEVARDHAITREALRIFEYTQLDLREVLSEQMKATTHINDTLAQHATDEARDRTRLLAGVITAALSGLGTIAVLIWGVWEVIHGIT
jgi:hypothetical protein